MLTFLMLTSLVLYMSSSFRLLAVESRDFSHAKKERTACKAGQFHKLTTIFHSKQQRMIILSENNCHSVNFFSFASSSFFLRMRKITWLNSQQLKTRPHLDMDKLYYWTVMSSKNFSEVTSMRRPSWVQMNVSPDILDMVGQRNIFASRISLLGLKLSILVYCNHP